MPNRVIREGILSSDRVNQLSPLAELFYRRLMSIVDDFGRYTANPSMLKAHAFPLRTDTVKEQDVDEWLSECVQAGLIALYQGDGKPCLELLDFNQRTRLMRPKYPLRLTEFIHCWEEIAGDKRIKRFEIRDRANDGHMTVILDATSSNSTKLLSPPQNDGHLTVSRRSSDGLNPNPNPNPKGGGESEGRQSHDGHLTVICPSLGGKESKSEKDGPLRFEPVPKGLYRREYEAMIADAQKTLKAIKAEPTNYAKDLSKGAGELIDWLLKERTDGWQARIAEVEAKPESYVRTNPKPKTASLIAAWVERIEQIKAVMNGVIN
ncbi:MAG: hypothetical protein JWR19_2189 [Pedosphaera sp.]|nr:hypothetical protein [Pedosphaera sp.]